MSLREKLLRGGTYLAVRQGLGLVTGLAGVMLLTRAIGPGNYGLFATALGIVVYLGNLAGLGVNVYLIRRETEPGMREYHQAFTLMFLTGGAGLLLGVATVPLFRLWFRDAAFLPPLLAMFLALPLITLTGPAMARLERELNYKAVAIIELTGQVINYSVALFLAYRGRGVWAPVTGYLTWQAFNFLAASAAAGMTLRPYWSAPLIKEMLRYGGSYSASMWVWQLRTLVNPLIGGRYLGAEAVGQVALAIRLVDALGFIKGVTWRISIAAFAKIQGDFRRLKEALDEAMVLQVLAVGPLFAAFACAAPWALPLLFGSRWNAVLVVFPFIAAGSLVNAVFSMHSSVLYVRQRNWDVTAFHTVHILIFAAGAFLLVPRLGLVGYGMAELLALGSYLVIHLRVKHLFTPSYMDAVPWAAAFLFPLFGAVITPPPGLLLWLPLLIVLVPAGPRGKLLAYLKFFKTRDSPWADR